MNGNHRTPGYYDDRYDVRFLGCNGEALIICDLQREGAWKDVQAISEFFESNGFRTTMEGRPTAKRLEGALKSFQSGLSYGDVSSAIVVIMAHGVQGHIILPVYREDYDDYNKYDQDCRKPPVMELAKIFQMFDNRQCPAMQEKPKLFIVQACRGDGEHSGNPSHRPTCDAAGFSAPFHGHELLPTMSDYMIVYSAPPGQVSFRHPFHGCPLFKELSEVVHEFGRTQHMREIFIKVTQRLRKRQKRDWAQVGVLDPPDNSIHIEYRLSKKWFLSYS